MLQNKKFQNQITQSVHYEPGTGDSGASSREAGESDTDTKGTLGRVGLSGLLGQRAGPRFRPSVTQLWDLGQVTPNPKGSSFVFIVWEW